jgi:hypothetical protein
MNSYAEFNRTGPAAGGGLDSYVAPDLSSGTAISSSDFRKLDCGQGETRVGRDSFYTCNGKVFKKTMVAGVRKYVVVDAIPY